MTVKWYRRKPVWITAVALVSAAALFELTLLWSGNQLLLAETIVEPGRQLTTPVEVIRPIDKPVLVCRYFTGRSFLHSKFGYGVDKSAYRECPTIYKPALDGSSKGEDNGSLADWVSGIGSLLAVIAALFGYFLVEKARRADARDKIQGHIYQIGFKLATIASEARITLRDLNTKGLPVNELIAEENPLEVCGSQAVVLGYDRTMVRTLSDEEQNFLMMIKEEEFLMDLMECVTRNESVRGSFVEYGTRREHLLTKLPQAETFTGQTGSFGLSQQQYNDLLPYLLPTTSLMRQARYLAKLNVDMITKLADAFMPMMRRHYPDMHVHKIEMHELPPGSPQGL